MQAGAQDSLRLSSYYIPPGYLFVGYTTKDFTARKAEVPSCQLSAISYRRALQWAATLDSTYRAEMLSAECDHLMNFGSALPVRQANCLESASPDPLPSRQITVLLAEDDPDLRFVMECSVRMMGYEILACPDAYTAAEVFATHGHIDILLTDYEMPGRTGIELARELTMLCPSLPVILITGSDLSKSTLEEIRTRDWVYLSKPCYVASLGGTMETVFNRRLVA